MANVFISHSSKDHLIAEKLCAQLEANGISCWIAPRDIHPGEEWAKAINDAITASDVFVIIYSAASSESTQVPKEIGLAGARKVYIVPYKIDGTPLKGEFEYHLLNSHWIVADIDKNDYKINELCETVRSVVNKKGHTAAENVTVNNNIGQINITGVKNDGIVNISPFIKKNKTLLLAAAVVLAVLLILSIIVSNVVKSLKTVMDNDAPAKNDTIVSIETDMPNQDLPPEQDKPSGVQEELAVNADMVQIPVDLEPYEYVGKIYANDKENSFTMAGKDYNTGIVLDRGQDGYILLNNASGFTKMKLTVGHIDGNNRDELKLRIKYDGDEAEIITIKPSALPEKYEFDITGVSGIEMVLDHSFYGSLIGITDFYMYNDTAAVPAYAQSSSEEENAAADCMQVPVDMLPYESVGTIYSKDKEKTFSIAGESYNTGIVLDRGQDGYILLNNSYGFTKMKFTAGHIDGYNRDELKLRIYYDGEEAEVITISTSALPVDYEFDITGVSGIKMALDHSFYGSLIGLTDFYLYNDTAPAKDIRTAEAEFSNVPSDIVPYELVGTALDNDKEKTFVVAGETCNTGITLDRGQDGYFLLNNTNYQYTKIRFTVGHIDGYGRDEVTLRIYFDNEEADVIKIKPYSLPTEYAFDIAGVNGIKLALDHSFYGSLIGITDFYMYNDTAPVKEAGTAEAESANVPEDIRPYEFTGTVLDNDKERSFVMAGETYNTGIKLNRGNDEYFLLNNTNYQYTKIKFTAGHIDESGDGTITLRIYLDGEETEVINIEDSSMPKEYEFNIAGVKGIRLALDHSFYGACIGITDISLSR